jgi:hypothetical protein
MIKIDKAGGAVFTIKIAMPAWSSLNVRCPMVIKIRPTSRFRRR